jgi:hypothetical protein
MILLVLEDALLESLLGHLFLGQVGLERVVKRLVRAPLLLRLGRLRLGRSSVGGCSEALSRKDDTAFLPRTVVYFSEL